MGSRHTFPLNTGNRENAGKVAASIYLFLLANGWETTLEKYAPASAPKKAKPATVGEYIEEAKASASVDPRTLNDYASSFRRIVADVCGIDPAFTVTKKAKIDGKEVQIIETRDARYDYRGEAGKKWQEKVNAVRLSEVTLAKVQKWKLAYVRENAGNDLAKERSAKVTANSILRKAKGLFSKNVLPFVEKSLALPDPLPLEGVKFFPRQSTRYVSKIDFGALVGKAFKELPDLTPEPREGEEPTPGEPFKIFLLAMGAGLRAKEIDSLLWRQVDLKAETISIEATPYFKPKSEDSAGVVEIDSEIAEILQGYRAKARGEFVIESNRPPRPNASYHYLRADRAFHSLNAWLKTQGVTAGKPLHELRKEFGSQVCREFGIYAASRALRHADVAITAAHYLDKGERVTVGLGRFLKPDNVTELNSETEEVANG